MRRLKNLSSQLSLKSNYLSSMEKNPISFFDQETAQKFDAELMSKQVGFTLDILMELAGQSIANTVKLIDNEKQQFSRILVICGPGNNGGDGIVSARHLKMMGYDVDITFSRQPQADSFFERLTNICKANQIKIYIDWGQFSIEQLVQKYNEYTLIVDAILGFSFKPPIRSPLKEFIETYKYTKTPILAVDLPSGWDVEKGNIDNNLFTPQYLISLTLPKEGVRNFKGRHFLGGRFVPIELLKKYNLKIPEYKGSQTIQEITSFFQ